MMYFSSMFSAAKENYCMYKGDKIYRCDFIEKPGKYYLKFRFIKENKKVEQLIILAFTTDCEYKIYYKGKEMQAIGKRFPTIDLTKDFFGKEFVLEIELIKGRIGICNGNIKMLGDKSYVTYMVREHAMKIEEKGNTKIYHCNSTLDEDNFDDLVFEIEFLDKYEKDYYENLNEVFDMYNEDYHVEWESKGKIFYLYFNNDKNRIYVSKDIIYLEKYNNLFKTWIPKKHCHLDNFDERHPAYFDKIVECCNIYIEKYAKKKTRI